MDATAHLLAESGLEVRRMGPSGAGAAVVVLGSPGAPAGRVAAWAAAIRTAMGACAGSLYGVSWRCPGGEHAALGPAHFTRAVFPRLLRRVTRDAAMCESGPLHLVGVGQSGVLLMDTLATCGGALPAGRVVLCGAAVAPDRAPIPRRSTGIWSDHRWDARTVSLSSVALIERFLAGPSGWKRMLEQLEWVAVPGPSGRIAGVLLRDRGRSSVCHCAVPREALILAGSSDSEQPPSTCFPAAEQFVPAARTAVIAGARSPGEVLSRSAGVVARHLKGGVA